MVGLGRQRKRESQNTAVCVYASRLQSPHLAPSLLVVVVGVPRLLLWQPHGPRLSEVRVHRDAMLSHRLWRWGVLVLHLGGMNKHGSLPLCVRLLVASCKVV